MCDKIIWNIISIIVSVIIAVIIGVIIGFLTFGTILLGIINAIVVALAIGVITLVGVIFLTICGNTRRCICKNGVLLAIASVGLIITTIIAIATTVLPGIITTAFLVGIIAFFLTFILIEVLRLAICLIKNNCCRRE